MKVKIGLLMVFVTLFSLNADESEESEQPSLFEALELLIYEASSPKQKAQFDQEESTDFLGAKGENTVKSLHRKINGSESDTDNLENDFYEDQ